jgi:hypothetical protein
MTEGVNSKLHLKGILMMTLPTRNRCHKISQVPYDIIIQSLNLSPGPALETSMTKYVGSCVVTGLSTAGPKTRTLVESATVKTGSDTFKYNASTTYVSHGDIRNT